MFLEAKGALSREAWEHFWISVYLNICSCCISRSKPAAKVKVRILIVFFHLSHLQDGRDDSPPIRRSERFQKAQGNAPAGTELYALGYLKCKTQQAGLFDNRYQIQNVLHNFKRTRDKHILALVAFIQYLKLARTGRSTYQSNTATKMSWI